MKKTKSELRKEYIDQFLFNFRRIKSSLSAYPSLVQPKFIIEHFRKQKINPILCYQYASFIRDGYEQFYKLSRDSFTRKITGEKDCSLDVPYSFSEFLCLKNDKMFKIIRQGFFDVEKISQINSFSINQKFHLDLFDPKKRSIERANAKCKQMICIKIKEDQEDLEDIYEEEMFSFSCNQFYIKTFGWQDGIILSQLLYWTFINKRETIFFSDSEFSKRLYFDIKTIRKSKIWDQDFVSKKPSGKKFMIRIDLENCFFS